MNSNLIKLAAFQLQTLPSEEVVKVAGVVRRLKNWIRGITDQEFSEQQQIMNSESYLIQSMTKEVNNAIDALLSAVKDGDVEEYQVSLTWLRELSQNLVGQLRNLNNDAAKIHSTLIAPQRKYNKEQYNDPEKLRDVVIESVQKRYPEHDVPYSKSIDAPVQSFSWFKRYLPNKIHVKEGNGDGAKQNLIKTTAKTISEETKLTLEEAVAFLSRSDIFAQYLNNLQIATLNGELVDYTSSEPGETIKERSIGEIDLKIRTAPFEIPEIGVVARCVIDLHENILIRSVPKLTFNHISYYSIDTGGIPVAMKKANVDYEIIKNAELPDLGQSFWSAFNAMCGRLGCQPQDLAKVIYSESKFNPAAVNYQNGHAVAKGLNQITKATGLRLGMSADQWGIFEKLSATEQLPYVEKYFKNVGVATGADGNWKSATQLYVANFAPKFTHKASDPNTVLYSATTNPMEYEQNKGLDRDHKGYISAGDMAKSVGGKLPDQISQNLNGVTSTPSVDETDNLLNVLYSEPNGKLSGLIKKAILKDKLPTSKLLVSCSVLAASNWKNIKFAKMLSKTLEEMFQAQSEILNNGKVEIKIAMSGSEIACLQAVRAVGECITKVVKDVNFKVML